MPLPCPGPTADSDSQMNFSTSKTVKLDSQTNFNTSTTSDDLSHCFGFDLIRGRRNAGDHRSGGRVGLKLDFVFFTLLFRNFLNSPIFCLSLVFYITLRCSLNLENPPYFIQVKTFFFFF